MADSILTDGLEAAWEAWLPMMPEGMAAMVRDAFSRTDPKSQAAALRAIASQEPFESLEEVRALTMPTLVIPGGDPNHPSELGERYGALLARPMISTVDMWTGSTDAAGFAARVAPAIKRFGPAGEHERLAVLERNYDPDTFRLLEYCGVEPGSTRAEVGAGRGSVPAWLADAVGPDGSVVAFDIDTTHLDHLSSRPNADVRHQDIVAENIGEASFDLVHARLVIEHLPEPERLLETLAAATRPGGLLIIESTDMLTTAAADPSDPRNRAFDEFTAMSFAVMESMSTFALSTSHSHDDSPRLFNELGFEESRTQVVGPIARGGDDKALEYALPVDRPMRPAQIERGPVSVDVIDDYLSCLAEQEFWFVANSVVSAWGRHAGTRS